MLDAVAQDLIPCSGDLIVFVAIYIDPGATDETAVRLASRAATLKGVRTAREGRARDATRALVDRRDSLSSPFYGGREDHLNRAGAVKAAAFTPLPRGLGPGSPDLRSMRRSCASTPTRASRASPAATRWTGSTAFEHLFIGRDPLALAAHARTLETISFHAGRYWPLEAALWDLAGKALGVARAALLGGARDRIPAYASLGELRSPEQRAEDAVALVDAGFRAVKVRIGPGRGRRGDRVGGRRFARPSETGCEIMVDLNQWWRMAGDITPGLDPQAAAARDRALCRARGAVGRGAAAGDDLPGCGCCARAPAPGSPAARWRAGLMSCAAPSMHDALDVLQPDVVLALGISGARTIAELALRRNRWFTPHTWTNGIGLLANLHVCCGVGGGPYLEYPYDPPGWTPERRDFMLAAPVGSTPTAALARARRARAWGSSSTRRRSPLYARRPSV